MRNQEKLPILLFIASAADSPSCHQTSVQQLRRCVSSTCPSIIQRERDRELHMTAIHADHCCNLIPTLNRFNVNYRIDILRLQERLTWSASSDGACVGIVMSWVSISMFIITSPRSRLWKRFETNWKQIDARLQLHWFEGLRRSMAFSNTQGVALKWIQWPWKRRDALEQIHWWWIGTTSKKTSCVWVNHHARGR